jgi:hypothetical protein
LDVYVASVGATFFKNGEHFGRWGGEDVPELVEEVGGSSVGDYVP